MTNQPQGEAGAAPTHAVSLLCGGAVKFNPSKGSLAHSRMSSLALAKTIVLVLPRRANRTP
jgi:hypothetical protein